MCSMPMQKFFLRNRSKFGEIKCTTGLQNCAISSSNRRLCPHCRLAKCFAIGIRGRGRIRINESGPQLTFTGSNTDDDDCLEMETSSERRESEWSDEQLSSPTHSAHSSEFSSGGGSETAVVKLHSPMRSFSDCNSPMRIERPPILFDGSTAEMSLRTIIKSATELNAIDHVNL